MPTALSHRKAKRVAKPATVKLVIATLELGMVIRRFGAPMAEDQAALRLAIFQSLG
jgi:hypothetical protein